MTDLLDMTALFYESLMKYRSSSDFLMARLAADHTFYEGRLYTWRFYAPDSQHIILIFYASYWEDCLFSVCYMLI